MTNADILNQTDDNSTSSRIQRRRLAVFGLIHRFPGEVLARAALDLAVNARLELEPDIRQQWTRLHGRTSVINKDLSFKAKTNAKGNNTA